MELNKTEGKSLVHITDKGFFLPMKSEKHICLALKWYHQHLLL